MSINIKLERDVLVVKLDEGRAFSEQKNDVYEYLKKMKNFLTAADVKISYSGCELNFYEEVELCNILDEIFGYKVNFCRKTHPPKEVMRHILANGERLSLRVNRTVRGGEKISSNGDLIVIGDVNPTAQLEAVGDIYVIGRLSGIAHAGVSGDKTCVIFSTDMNPEQIKIAEISAFKPNDVTLKGCASATLNNGEILIKNL
jgi:septum site-determining protein MinC